MTPAEKFRRLTRLYAVSSGINEAIVRIPQESRLFEEACRIAVEKGGLVMAWVGLAQPGADALAVAARWGKDDGYLDSVAIHITAHGRQGQGPAGVAFRSGAPAVSNDIASDGQFFAWRQEALDRGFRSCAAFPIQLQGRPIGVFVAYATEPMYFDQGELQLLTVLAENFSFAIESRRKDLALRDSDARLSAWLEKLRHGAGLLGIASRLGHIGAWEIDLPQNAITWTDELCAIHDLPPGYSPTLEQALSYYAPDDRTTIERSFNACVNHGTPFDVEVDVITPTGRRVHGRSIGEAVRDPSGRICRVQGAFQDVSEKRRAQEEIRQLAERLGTTLDSITDAIVTVDRDWRITFVNREAERVLQRDRGQLLGTELWAEFPQGRNSQFEQQYAVALAERRTVEFEEYFEPLKAWLELRVYPSPQGGLTIYFRDVTERRRSRQQVVDLNAQLEQRVRERTAQLELANHELGAFSYSVAHDLRAPLAAISGFSHALEHELAGAANPSEKSRHYLERMRVGLHQTHEMIDAMLSLSQLSRTELRWDDVDLAAMASTAFENLRRQQPGRDAVMHVGQALTARGDPRLLQLVLDNLVGNAWKFSGDRPRAEISVGKETSPEGETVFLVSDSGVGFDMEYAGKLFGAFQRLHTQAEFPGTGIGLANVWRIVSRHGGRVWARARPGEGATFYFTLGQLPPA